MYIINEEDFKNHVISSDVSSNSFKKNQLIFAPASVGKTTLFVLEVLYKTLAHSFNNALLVALPSPFYGFEFFVKGIRKEY